VVLVFPFFKKVLKSYFRYRHYVSEGFTVPPQRQFVGDADTAYMEWVWGAWYAWYLEDLTTEALRIGS
jgi:hypothetical protein